MKPLTAFKIIPDRKQELIDIKDLFDLPNRQDKDYLKKKEIPLSFANMYRKGYEMKED